MLPLYINAKPGKSKPQDAHSGLWYERFFDRYKRDGHKIRVLEGNDENKNPKVDWIAQVAGPVGESEQIRSQALCQLSLAEQLGGAGRVFVNDWHFVTGLGNPHPVENGFAWHPVLGVPYLPGSAVKGLLRSYIDVWRQDYHHLIADWFGDEDKQAPGDAAGNLIFFDALPIEPLALCVDIMTPHMGSWYAEGAERPNQEDTVPADWHDPTPIPFLAAREIKLLFSIASRHGTHAEEEPQRALDLMEEALDISGAGAKTAAGYGLMSRSEVDDVDFVKQACTAHEQREAAATRRTADRKRHRQRFADTGTTTEQSLQHRAEAYQRRRRERLAEQRAARIEQLEGTDRRLAEIELALQDYRESGKRPDPNEPVLQEVNAALNEAVEQDSEWSPENARSLIALARSAWELADMKISGKRQRKIDAVEGRTGD